MGSKLFGKAHQQFAPVHPRIVHQPIKGVVVNLFKKVLTAILHPQILSLRSLKISKESKSTETSTPLLLKEPNEPKSRPILKVEKKWRIPSLVFSLLQRTFSNSLKCAIFDAISSCLLYTSPSPTRLRRISYAVFC